MPEQCHHWENGVRCTKKAVVKVTQKEWQTYACYVHRKVYEEHYKNMYTVKPLVGVN